MMPAPVIKLFLWRIAAELLLSQLVACLKGDPYGRDSISGLARRVRIMQQQAISKGVTDDWQTNAVLDRDDFGNGLDRLVGLQPDDFGAERH